MKHFEKISSSVGLKVDQGTKTQNGSQRNSIDGETIQLFKLTMACKVLTHLFVLATIGCLCAGKLIIKPRNTDAKVNQSTYFNCSTDYGSTAIFWFHETKYVYTGFAILEPYHERFEIHRYVWNGTYIYNLVIHSVQPGDAGKYICAEDEGVGEQHSVQLAVLDADPICRSNRELDEVIGQNTCNIEPDEVELECSVTYHGNIPPQMEWKKVGENSSTPLEVSVVTSRNHFVSTLKLKGDISLNNSSYVCETKRTTQEPIKCTSKVRKILYALSDNLTANRSINDELLCQANTTQSCKYKWRWFDDNDVTTESSTAILKPNKLGWHKCEAECYLRNKTCNLLVMRTMVYDEKESSQTRAMTIYVVISVMVTLVVVGALIFICLWINRRKGPIGTELHSSLTPKTYYLIKSHLSGLVLDVQFASVSPGTRVITWPRKNWRAWNNQLWYDDSMTGTIRSKATGHCLDLSGNSLVVNPYDRRNRNQQWERHGTIIRTRHAPHQVIDVAENKRPGAGVFSHDQNGSTEQQFDFVFVPGLTEPYTRRDFFIVSEMHNKVLDISGGNPDAGATVIVCPKQSPVVKNQLWYFDQNGVIFSAFNNMVLESQDHTQARVMPFRRHYYQQWTAAGKQIIGETGMCLTIQDGQHTDGAAVQSYRYKRSSNQHWLLEFV